MGLTGIVKMESFLHIILLLAISANVLEGAQLDEDYVDPFDLMNFDPTHVTMANKEGKDEKAGTVPLSSKANLELAVESQTAVPTEKGSEPCASCVPCPNISVACRSLTPLFRQYVLQLVHVLGPKVPHLDQRKDLSLRLLVSGHDLAILQRYGEDDDNAESVHAVHETLSHMIQEASEMQHVGSTFYWLEERLGLSTEVFFHLSVMGVCAVVTVKSILHLSLKWIVVFMYGLSVAFTWMEMFQKEKADQEKMFMQGDKSHCAKLSELPWYSRLVNYFASTVTFQDEDCREYYQAMLVNPVFKVSPIEACAVAFIKTIMTPLEIVGHGFKRFLIGLLKDLPIQLQTYLLVFMVVFILLALFMASGYCIRVPWLLSIEPTYHQSRPQVKEATPVVAGQLGQGSYPVVEDGQGLPRQRDQQQDLESLPTQMSRLSLQDGGDSMANVTASAGAGTENLPTGQGGLPIQTVAYCGCGKSDTNKGKHVEEVKTGVVSIKDEKSCLIENNVHMITTLNKDPTAVDLGHLCQQKERNKESLQLGESHDHHHESDEENGLCKCADDAADTSDKLSVKDGGTNECYAPTGNPVLQDADTTSNP